MDLLELIFLLMTSTCWAVLPSNFPTDNLMKIFIRSEDAAKRYKLQKLETDLSDKK